MMKWALQKIAANKARILDNLEALTGERVVNGNWGGNDVMVDWVRVDFENEPDVDTGALSRAIGQDCEQDGRSLFFRRRR